MIYRCHQTIDHFKNNNNSNNLKENKENIENNFILPYYRIIL